jgi:hypothetical protein
MRLAKTVAVKAQHHIPYLLYLIVSNTISPAALIKLVLIHRQFSTAGFLGDNFSQFISVCLIETRKSCGGF